MHGLQEVFASSARDALTTRLQGSLSAANATTANEMDQELALQVVA